MIDGPKRAPSFAAGNAGADEEDSFGGEVFGAPVRIGEQGIAAVDDDVSFRQERQKMIDHLIDGCRRLSPSA